MEIFILVAIPLVILFIAWYQNEYDMTVRKGKKFGDRSNKSIRYYQNEEDKKTVPDGYYQSEEYKKFCEERTKKYNELIATGEIEGFSHEEEVFYGERGGRYRIRYNKDGEPYRDYF